MCYTDRPVIIGSNFSHVRNAFFFIAVNIRQLGGRPSSKELLRGLSRHAICGHVLVYQRLHSTCTGFQSRIFNDIIPNAERTSMWRRIKRDEKNLEGMSHGFFQGILSSLAWRARGIHQHLR